MLPFTSAVYCNILSSEWHNYNSFQSFKRKLLDCIYSVFLPGECPLVFHNVEMCISHPAKYLE
jgi:hypothetical protein